MAVMLCGPGAAEAGMVTDPVSVPVAELTSRSASVVSRYTSTASLAAKPLPVMATVCVGCTLRGAGVTMLAAAAVRSRAAVPKAVATRSFVIMCNAPVPGAD